MPTLAQVLIAENKRTREPSLDLGNCGLRKIPAEVGKLTWLESLSFTDGWNDWDGTGWQWKRSKNRGDENRFTDLAPLSGLTQLHSLFMGNNPIRDLKPLGDLTSLQVLDVGNTQVNDLAPLAQLTSLRSLFVSSAQVSDLAPLAKLTLLQTLYVSGKQISDLAPLAQLTSLQLLNVTSALVSDLAPLANLTSLQSLDLSFTQVSDLAPLANLSSLQSLDLSFTQVSDLAPLANLTSLQTLNVSHTQVSDLAPLANLTSLQTLNVSHTHVSDLTPFLNLTSLQTLNVSYTHVSDLAPLANLTSLRTLNVLGTSVSDFTPLVNLTSLHSLDLSGTKFSDSMPLVKLTSLHHLDLSGTKFSDLTPLANLTSLQTLNVSDTPVSDLTPLAKLTSLETLDVSNAPVRSLAPLLELIQNGMLVKWSERWWEGPGIYVAGCPLTDPPREIVAQGNDAILNYFAEKARGEVDHLYEAKMLVLGEGGAGKTSLVRRLYQPGAPMPEEKDTTRGIEIHKHEFQLKNGRTFRLNVWDFGGQQIYHATHQFFLTSRSLYVLLDDTRKDPKSVSDEGFRFWLELIDVFGGHSPTLIFQNEKGGRSKDIGFSGIVQRYDNVKELFRGNLEHPGAADKLRAAIEYFAANLDHIGEELPAGWIRVRTDIEQMASERPYVDVEEYFKIYSRHLEPDETKALYLSRYLHDLGVFLHFQDDALLMRTVVLQNEWATTAVFRILDDETVKGRFGRFDQADCARLWKGTGYDRMRPELLALMQKFELCYALRDSDSPTWLAPQLLPAEKPKDLLGWALPGDLILRYKYVFLPRGTISRLTVRQHRYVRDPRKAWVTGVLFEHGKTEVLVEVLPNGNEIELRARGPENKALLNVISADLDALNDSFKGLRDKVEKRIPCICQACRATDPPDFYGYKELLERKERGKRTIECKRPPYEEVEVLQLLEGVRSESPPEWAKDGSREICIFLASSSELSEERNAFEEYFRRQNDNLRKEGLYLKIIRWEHFLDAISQTRLQDEYNRKVSECDVFVSLFFTKAGRFTEEEFDVAFGQFKDSGRPLIYTYFKDADVKVSSLKSDDLKSREKFIEKLKSLGHYHTVYGSTDELKLRFRDQMDMIREKLKM